MSGRKLSEAEYKEKESLRRLVIENNMKVLCGNTGRKMGPLAHALHYGDGLSLWLIAEHRRKKVLRSSMPLGKMLKKLEHLDVFFQKKELREGQEQKTKKSEEKKKKEGGRDE